LNADVLSTAIDASSLPPNSETGLMLRMGKRSLYSVVKTVTTAEVTAALTTSVPVCGAPSKPQ